MTFNGKREIYITGEISSSANVDIENVARNTIKEVGYNNADVDIDYRTCKITINISKQSWIVFAMIALVFIAYMFI